MVITRNPFGFYSSIEKISKIYKGVKLGENGNVDDETFIEIITNVLSKAEITIVPLSISVEEFTCLPDTLETFGAEFIKISQDKSPKIDNMNLFKSRILGLVSYFPDIDELLPKYNKETDFHKITIPMSNFQFKVYERARVEERKIEKNNAKKRARGAKKGAGGEIYEDAVSTYRIFSRAFCNFVFPDDDIKRPLPNDEKNISETIIQTANEDLVDAVSVEENLKNAEEKYDEDDLADLSSKTVNVINKSYEVRIKEAITQLDQNKDKYLTPKELEIYSPKFLNILSKVLDQDKVGLHLIYSQFRTLEGIGILSLVFKTNGFTQFKIQKDGKQEWQLNIPDDERGKPTYALYTGTEDAEEKEIIRNIFNSNWELVPDNLRKELLKISSNNLFGEVIKIIMITASGAEGISLENVRYVHITEPYWHPVRIEQVIGRARRICSHKNLDEKYRTVEVFLYLMQFTDEQLEADTAIELKLNDKSKLEYEKKIVKEETSTEDKTSTKGKKSTKDKKIYEKIPFTSDQALYEIATIKEGINKEILKNIKEASIDCNIHQKPNSKEQLKCFTFNSVNPDKFAYIPNIMNQDKDDESKQNKEEVILELKKVTIEGEVRVINYANVRKQIKDKDANIQDKDGIIEAEVYTLDSSKSGNPVQIGVLLFKNLKPHIYKPLAYLDET